MSDEKQVIGWCVLELMGHRRLGGFVRPVEIAGAPFLRIDVPTPDTQDESGPWSATQMYSPSAVYCMTPTTMAMAKIAAASSEVAPVSRWELPPAKETAPPRRVEIDHGEDDDDLEPF